MFGTALLTVTLRVVPDDRPITQRERRGTAQRDDLTCAAGHPEPKRKRCNRRCESAGDRSVSVAVRCHGVVRRSEHGIQGDRPVDFREAQHKHWDSAAVGWMEWSEFNHSADGHISERLVELAGVQSGSRVLDAAAGYGEPALTAARKAGP
jgi:hypothetical protein